MTDEKPKSVADYIVIAGRRRWFERIRPAKPGSSHELLKVRPKISEDPISPNAYGLRSQSTLENK